MAESRETAPQRQVRDHPLVGTWRLRSFEFRRPGQTSYPFGPDARGYLVYTADGFMSWAVMHAARPRFATDDLLQASAAERIAAAETHLAYCGRHSVQGNRVTHHIEVARFPNQIDTDHVRSFELDGDRLIITSPPVLAGGTEQIGVMVLERAPAI